MRDNFTLPAVECWMHETRNLNWLSMSRAGILAVTATNVSSRSFDPKIESGISIDVAPFTSGIIYFVDGSADR